MPGYLIQKYSVSNWDAVSGRVPFVATGPRFQEFAIPGSLERFGEHRFVSGLRLAMEAHLGGLQTDWRDVAAEWLLEMGIVQAIWSVDGGECVPEELRWAASVAQVAREIPKGEVVPAVIDLLSGLGDPAHFRAYVAEDGLTLEPCPSPAR